MRLLAGEEGLQVQLRHLAGLGRPRRFDRLAEVRKASLLRKEPEAPLVPLLRRLPRQARVHRIFLPMFFLTFFLTFGEFLANFERLVLDCIEAEFCK